MSSTDTSRLSTYGLDTSIPTSDEDDEEEEEEESQEPEKPSDPREHLTAEQVKEFKAIFSAFDADGSGKVPAKYLATIIRGLGHNPTKAQIRAWVRETDPDIKGKMIFHGFLLPMARIMHMTPETMEEIIAAFATLDENEEGFLRTNELASYLSNLGESLEDYELELLIKMADPKGEGKINYTEFVEKLIGPPKKKPKKPKKGKKAK